ncbi:hypothetical protein AB0N05_37440 [Nocardia sp. NPDC051030]|uniref:hypothetical protein n=1 Tax=Nocardia sp. NPDC051030 TaxID=3155162 RepID=UPI003422FA23
MSALLAHRAEELAAAIQTFRNTADGRLTGDAEHEVAVDVADAAEAFMDSVPIWPQSDDAATVFERACELLDFAEERVATLALQCIAALVHRHSPEIRYLDLDWGEGGLHVFGYRDEHGEQVTAADDVEDNILQWTSRIADPQRAGLIGRADGPFVLNLRSLAAGADGEKASAPL